MARFLRSLFATSFLIVFALASTHAADESIDWDRAGRLHRRAQAGEKLNADDQAYYDRARRELAARNGRPPGGAGTPAAGRGQGVPAAVDLSRLIPLPELGADEYRGETGGLYGGGKNTPPDAHRRLAEEAAREIRPRDASGRPASDGKIALVSLGMSNTTQEFSRFKELADRDPRKSPFVTIVDGAQGGQTGSAWAGRGDRARSRPWEELDRRLERAGIAAPQVQAFWIKQAEAGPASLGAFPAHARVLEENLVTIIGELHSRFPKLRLVFLSSRTYGGFATTHLNPEPYAYESAFAVRHVIQRQIDGERALNADPARGEVQAPVLLWGPYVWGAGPQKSSTSGLITWTREDFLEDGTHPSQTGRLKVGEALVEFFVKSQSSTWFVK